MSPTPQRDPRWHAPPEQLISRVGLLCMAGAALVANIAVRAQVANVSAVLAVVAVVVILWRYLELRPSPATVIMTTTAIGSALALMARVSTWLIALNSLVALASLIVLATLAGPNPPRFSVNSLLANLGRVGGMFYAPLIVVDAAKPRSGLVSRALPLVRGLALAALPVLVLGALLASADAVFAEAISVDVALGGSIEHAVLTAVFLAAVAGLVGYGATANDPRPGEIRVLGAIETLVVLGSVGTVFALFAAIQLASALGQTDAFLEAQGVSHADYARSGYFQLLWVAALTAMLLAALRLLARRGTPRQAALQRTGAAIVAMLTCVIVASAIVRLGLYTDAFGQTTLRWYSEAFAWMLGAGFVLSALACVRESARWLPLALISLTAATLFVVNVVNPEARIAEHNLRHAGDDVELDADYLLRLSADAWPTLLKNRDQIIDALGPDRIGTSVGEQFAWACLTADETNGYGPFGFNLALARLDCAAA